MVGYEFISLEWNAFIGVIYKTFACGSFLRYLPHEDDGCENVHSPKASPKNVLNGP